MKGSFEPRPMKDRFKGSSTTNVSQKRSFDQGGVRDFVGADIAPYRGNVNNQAQASARVTQRQVSSPGSTGLGSAKPTVKLGYPKTGGPKLRIKNGAGPKVTNNSTAYVVQKGATGGSDKSPKGGKTGQGQFQKGGIVSTGSRSRR